MFNERQDSIEPHPPTPGPHLREAANASSIRGDARQTRRKLLMAASRHIHRKGFRATGLSDFLPETELTKGAFYHHFPTKLHLGYAIIDELLTAYVDEMWLSLLRDSRDPITALKAVLSSLTADSETLNFGCPINNLALEMSPVDEGFRERIEHLYRRWISGVGSALSRGQEAGMVSVSVNARDAATFIVAAAAGCRGLAKNARSGATLVRALQHLGRYLDTLKP